MSLKIGDTVNWINGGFTAGPAVIVEQVTSTEYPGYNVSTNECFKIQFPDGNWTIIDSINLVKV